VNDTPLVTGVWTAAGDELCGDCRCGLEAGEGYMHVPLAEDSNIGLVVCLGCAAHAAMGGA